MTQEVLKYTKISELYLLILTLSVEIFIWFQFEFNGSEFSSPAEPEFILSLDPELFEFDPSSFLERDPDPVLPWILFN